MRENINMYVAGKPVNNKFVPMVLIIKVGWNMYKVKSHIELFKDNYGHITTKRNKFYKNQNPIKEGETHDISNLISELKNTGLEIVELHGPSPENAYDVPVSDSIVPA